MSWLRPSNNTRDLTASFETRSKQPATPSSTPSSSSSNAGDPANMAPDKRKLVPSLAQSIDAVVEAPASKIQSAVRPLLSLRPSWIGPARSSGPKAPGTEAMKQYVTIEYRSPGLQPPVYIFTNLSDPQWDAVEMQMERGADGQYVFSKAFDAEEGEYQYKFRLGPGDWWVSDSTQPTVDDGMGNKNNLLVVKPIVFAPKVDSAKAEPTKPITMDVKTPAAPPSPPATPVSSPQPTKSTIPEIKDSLESAGPLSSTELIKIITKNPAPGSVITDQAAASPTSVPAKPSLTDLKRFLPAQIASMLPTVPTPSPEPKAVDPPSSAPLGSIPLPLTSREVFAHPSDAQSQQTPDREQDDPLEQDVDPDAPTNQNVDDSATTTTNNDGDDNTDSDSDDEPHTSPLLRHESIRPSTQEQHHAPLFRHESISVHDHRPDLASITKSPAKTTVHGTVVSHIPHEADPEDTSLETFPTHHAGILEKIQHTVISLPEDSHSDHGSPLSHVISGSSGSSPTLASVLEDDDDEETEELLDKIHDAAVGELAQEEADGWEMDPLTDADSPENEPEDDDFSPKVAREADAVVIEVVERQKNAVESMIETVGGPMKALAIAVGMLILTASIAYMQLSRRSVTT